MSQDVQKKSSKMVIIIAAVVIVALGGGYLFMSSMGGKIVEEVEAYLASDPIYDYTYSEISYGSSTLSITDLVVAEKNNPEMQTLVDLVEIEGFNLDSLDPTEGSVVIADSVSASGFEFVGLDEGVTISMGSYIFEEPEGNLAEIIAAQELGMDSEEYWEIMSELRFGKIMLTELALIDETLNATLSMGSIEITNPEVRVMDLTVNEFLFDNPSESTKLEIGSFVIDDLKVMDPTLLRMAYELTEAPTSKGQDYTEFEEYVAQLVTDSSFFNSITLNGLNLYDGEISAFVMGEAILTFNTETYAVGFDVNDIEVTEERLQYWSEEPGMSEIAMVVPFVEQAGLETVNVSFGTDFVPMEDMVTVDLTSYVIMSDLFEWKTESELISPTPINEIDSEREFSDAYADAILNGAHVTFTDLGIIPRGFIVAENSFGFSPNMLQELALAEIGNMKERRQYSAYEPILTVIEEALTNPMGTITASLPENDLTIGDLFIQALVEPESIDYTISYEAGSDSFAEAVDAVRP